MEEILKQILTEVSALKDSQQKIMTRMDKIESKIDALEGKIDHVSGQQEEKNQVIKAIWHNTETLNVEVSALKLTALSKEALSLVSTKEDINKLSAKFEVMNSRLFNQEAELYELKAVK